MEQSSGFFVPGSSKSPSTSIQSNAWRIPGRSEMYHPSSDATLFSTSLPVLPQQKFNFGESDNGGQSFDDGFPSLNKVYQEDKVKDQIEDIGPNTEESFLLPGDEDELFAGIMDDFDFSGLPTQVEDLDDDFFGSGGGLEIESEGQDNLINGMSRLNMVDDVSGSGIANYGLTNGAAGNVSGEHPYGEHPSRTLFVRNINSNVEDSELRSLFEQYGDIRTLYTACKHRGFVMISYYDIRAARTAMRGLQNKSLRRRRLDIHFSIPKDNPSDKDINQGTLVVFNLDASVSNDDLRQIFGAYGEIKEIRETPHKRHHKFIEFFDVRAAEAALKALNRSDIAGKRIKLEPSRPGGTRRGLIQQIGPDQDPDELRAFRQQVGSPIGNSPPTIWSNYGSPVEHNISLHGYSRTPPSIGSLSPVGSNHLTGLASILPSLSNPVKIAPIGKDPTRVGSFPDRKLSPGPVSPFGNSNPSPSSIGTLSGPQFLWGSPTIHSDHLASPALSSKARPSGHEIGFPYTNQQHGSLLGSNYHVGSAPSGGIQFEKHFGFFPHSPETSSSLVNRVAFGVPNFSRNTAMNIGSPRNFNESGSPGSSRMLMPRNNPLYFGNASFVVNDHLIDHGRGPGRRVDTVAQVDTKKQYQLNLEKIVNGEDVRTTLMIKNIPNKYTSKMLLAAIDETHKGTYDFLYLPIDFKNKCNVGYAFINMVSPQHIISFYEAFNGKKWDKFNSEKVASLAYGRIQGKTGLITHFQNSSLMNEDKRCRPILFQSQGLELHDMLETLPTGNLNIIIRQPDGSYAGDSMDSPKGDDYDPDEMF